MYSVCTLWNTEMQRRTEKDALLVNFSIKVKEKHKKRQPTWSML